MIYFTEVLMPRETISVSHLTDKSQLANELVWADFKIKTPSGYTITPNDFDLIAIGNPNQQCEKWDMDVLFINTCGKMRPPVPVRHYDEDDLYISLSRGPLTLAADSRLGKDAKSNFTFARKKGRIECKAEVGGKVGEDDCMLKCRFEDEDGREFFLVDYASAGKDMESEIAAWLPQPASRE
jgi:hypothetical protein